MTVAFPLAKIPRRPASAVAGHHAFWHQTKRSMVTAACQRLTDASSLRSSRGAISAVLRVWHGEHFASGAASWAWAIVAIGDCTGQGRSSLLPVSTPRGRTTGPETSLLLTVPQVAVVFQATAQTIRDWIDHGSLPAVRVGRAFRVRREDVDADRAVPQRHRARPPPHHRHIRASRHQHQPHTHHQQPAQTRCPPYGVSAFCVSCATRPGELVGRAGRVGVRSRRDQRNCRMFLPWSQPGSNRRPPACKAGALPAELWPRAKDRNGVGRTVRGLTRHRRRASMAVCRRRRLRR